MHISWYRSDDPILTITMRRFKLPGKKKRQDRHIWPILVLFGAIPVLLQTLG